MKKILAYFSVLFVVLGAAIALNFGISQSQAQDARDCDDNAIIKCGAFTNAELTSKYTGDVPAVYNAFGVTSGEVKGTSGTMKAGFVTKTGDVVVDGKVVATGALTVGRQNMTGSTAITVDGKTYYRRAPAASFRSSQLEAFVYFDADGKFSGAVIKSCGNPVVATPKPVPQAACSGLTRTIISRTESSFDGTATARDGATVSSYVFTTTNASGTTVDTKTVNSAALKVNSGKVTLATPGTYTTRVTVKTSLGDRTSDTCKTTFTIAPAPASPVAACEGIVKNIISRNQFTFDASASALNGATISSYVFTTLNASGATVDTKTVTSTALKANSGTVTIASPGTYTTRVTVKTSLGDRTSDKCVATYTVAPENKPAVTIEKKVENVKHAKVGINAEYTYQLVVKNTGNVTLKNVAVSDKPQTGITLVSASNGTMSVGVIANNEWKYTIPEIATGASVSFTLKAKVPAFLAGNLLNTACVDATEVTGSPDKCDTATVEVPPTKITVCDLTTYKMIEINENEFDAKKHSKNPADCQMKACDKTTGVVITISKDKFDATKHSKTLTDCDKIEVCDIATKKIITIKRGDLDVKKHAESTSDTCKIQVCRLSDKQLVKINESAFDSKLYSRNADDCKVLSTTTTTTPVTPAAPAVIASTGPETMLGGLVGTSALGLGVSSFIRSRSAMKNAIEKR